MKDIALEQYALNYISSLMPKSYELGKFPSIRQCVGTNRLWGASLGQSMHEDLNGEIDVIKLINIAILSRSILVLDDHIDDEYLSNNETKCLTEYINRLEESLFDILDSIDEYWSTFQNLREQSKTEVAIRKNGKSLQNIYQSSINKCLIFFNPYRLKIAQKIFNIKQRIHFLEIFFFACQLLDDYQDLKEDLVKKTNHNIFFVNRSDHECSLIEKKHLSWTAILLFQVLQNLTRADVVAGSNNSRILSYFHESSISYINLMLSKCIGFQNINVKKIIKFEEWEFDPISNFSYLKFEAKLNRFIRPEFMQTYTQGFRNIELV